MALNKIAIARKVGVNGSSKAGSGARVTSTSSAAATANGITIPAPTRPDGSLSSIEHSSREVSPAVVVVGNVGGNVANSATKSEPAVVRSVSMKSAAIVQKGGNSTSQPVASVEVCGGGATPLTNGNGNVGRKLVTPPRGGSKVKAGIPDTQMLLAKVLINRKRTSALPGPTTRSSLGSTGAPLGLAKAPPSSLPGPTPTSAGRLKVAVPHTTVENGIKPKGLSVSSPNGSAANVTFAARSGVKSGSSSLAKESVTQVKNKNTVSSALLDTSKGQKPRKSPTIATVVRPTDRKVSPKTSSSSSKLSPSISSSTVASVISEEPTACRRPPPKPSGISRLRPPTVTGPSKYAAAAARKAKSLSPDLFATTNANVRIVNVTVSNDEMSTNSQVDNADAVNANTEQYTDSRESANRIEKINSLRKVNSLRTPSNALKGKECSSSESFTDCNRDRVSMETGIFMDKASREFEIAMVQFIDDDATSFESDDATAENSVYLDFDADDCADFTPAVLRGLAQDLDAGSGGLSERGPANASMTSDVFASCEDIYSVTENMNTEAFGEMVAVTRELQALCSTAQNDSLVAVVTGNENQEEVETTPDLNEVETTPTNAARNRTLTEENLTEVGFSGERLSITLTASGEDKENLRPVKVTPNVKISEIHDNVEDSVARFDEDADTTSSINDIPDNCTDSMSSHKMMMMMSSSSSVETVIMRKNDSLGSCTTSMDELEESGRVLESLPSVLNDIVTVGVTSTVSHQSPEEVTQDMR